MPLMFVIDVFFLYQRRPFFKARDTAGKARTGVKTEAKAAAAELAVAKSERRRAQLEEVRAGLRWPISASSHRLRNASEIGKFFGLVLGCIEADF